MPFDTAKFVIRHQDYGAIIFYKKTLHQLITERADICNSNSWSYKIWEEDWSEPQTLTMGFDDGAMKFEGHAPLKGISLSIGDSEMVWLTFLPNGLLQNYL